MPQALPRGFTLHIRARQTAPDSGIAPAGTRTAGHRYHRQGKCQKNTVPRTILRGATESVLRPMPRPERRRAPGRQRDPAGAPHGLPHLPAGVARPGLAAAAPAQLHDGCARGAFRLWRTGDGRAGAVPRGTRQGHGLGSAGSQALSTQAPARGHSASGTGRQEHFRTFHLGETANKCDRVT